MNLSKLKWIGLWLKTISDVLACPALARLESCQKTKGKMEKTAIQGIELCLSHL